MERKTDLDQGAQTQKPISATKPHSGHDHKDSVQNAATQSHPNHTSHIQAVASHANDRGGCSHTDAHSAPHHTVSSEHDTSDVTLVTHEEKGHDHVQPAGDAIASHDSPPHQAPQHTT